MTYQINWYNIHVKVLICLNASIVQLNDCIIWLDYSTRYFEDFIEFYHNTQETNVSFDILLRCCDTEHCIEWLLTNKLWKHLWELTLIRLIQRHKHVNLLYWLRDLLKDLRNKHLRQILRYCRIKLLCWLINYLLRFTLLNYACTKTLEFSTHCERSCYKIHSKQIYLVVLKYLSYWYNCIIFVRCIV